MGMGTDVGVGAPFGELLRRHRLVAGLTQEALAERAGVSARNVQNLERGVNRPLPETARRLADALGLDAPDRACFLALAAPAPKRREPSRAATPRHNVPQALSRLVGREADRATVLTLLAEARLVTLTGSGGVGKTRLALAVAAELVGRYPDGVWLVELAALTEARLVAQTVLETLGAREEAGRPLLSTLADQLKEKCLLLALDNCEHLVEACAALAEAVLRRCPGVRVLATSREGLGVAGEVTWRVPSLRVPDPRRPLSLAQAEGYEAVRLFVARARERRPDFALTAGNTRAVAEVCARLDGLPLAIELAAARVDSLGVEGVAARLDDRFRLLTGGPRTALPRQRTLRAALDWSYDLLTASEQLLLDRLSVFARGWTLAAAEAVCAGDGIEQSAVLDLLGSLVNKSLAQAEEGNGGDGGEPRYGLLETVRQYAGERLAVTGAAEAVRDRHLAWYLALAEEAEPHLWGAEQVRYFDQLEREHDNLRAALRWARERGAGEEALRLAGALGHFWLTRGYLGEGRGWLEGALAVGVGGPAVRARALAEAGDLATWQGDFGRGATLLEESLALYRASGDTGGIALVLSRLGNTVERQGDVGRALALHEEALAISCERGDPVGIAFCLTHLGWVACVRGEYGRATLHAEESVARFRAAGYDEGVAYALVYLACALDGRGAHARAAALAEEALALWRGVGSPAGIAWTLANLGWSLLALGEEGRATALLEESLALGRETGSFRAVAYPLVRLGWAAALRGEHGRAAAQQEQALALYRQVGYRWGIAEALIGLGCGLQAWGERARAAACLREGLPLAREIRARGLLAQALEGMAWLAAAEGRAARAASLGGAAEALRATLGATLHPVLHAGHERAARATCGALGEAVCATAWAEGQSLPAEEALALALAGDTEGSREQY